MACSFRHCLTSALGCFDNSLVNVSKTCLEDFAFVFGALQRKIRKTSIHVSDENPSSLKRASEETMPSSRSAHKQFHAAVAWVGESCAELTVCIIWRKVFSRFLASCEWHSEREEKEKPTERRSDQEMHHFWESESRDVGSASLTLFLKEIQSC